MPALGPRSRAGLAAGGLAAFALAYAGTPLVGRGDGVAPASDPPLTLAAAPLATPVRTVLALPRRDPFAGDPFADGAAGRPGAAPSPAFAAGNVTVVAAANAVPALPTAPMSPSVPWLPGTIGPLPPNAGAGFGLPPALVTAPAAGLRVTAVVSGPRAYALVEEPGGTRVVARGDLLGGDRIARIDERGVHLAHGTTLGLAPSGAGPMPNAPFAPSAPSPSTPAPGGPP